MNFTLRLQPVDDKYQDLTDTLYLLDKYLQCKPLLQVSFYGDRLLDKSNICRFLFAIK